MVDVARLKAKVQTSIQAGVQLGWLLDPETQTVYEFRPGALPRKYDCPRTMGADPVLPGFVLDLSEVWLSP